VNVYVLACVGVDGCTCECGMWSWEAKLISNSMW